MQALILCDGLSPSQALFEEHRAKADLFIAADGGTRIARIFNAPPDVVIGDLDSFKKQPDDPFEVILDTDQETNDLEKAMKLAAQKGISEVTVLGATGMRLDQTLKNLSVMVQFNELFDKIFFRDNFGDTFLLPPTYTGYYKIGTTISLCPLSGTVSGIETHGLKYPLHNEMLEVGVRDGSSNEVTKSPFRITHKTGHLLMFVLYCDS